MWKTFLTAILALAVAGVSAMASASSMYRWVDDQGNVHFGENPPTGVEAQELHSHSPAPGGTERRPETPSLQRDENGDDAAETVEQGDSDNVPAPDEEFCEQHRQNLQELQTRTVVRSEDPDTGEQQVLTQDEREAMIEETREALRACE